MNNSKIKNKEYSIWSMYSNIWSNSRCIQGVPLSRIWIRISTWQMGISKTYHFHKVAQDLSPQYLTKYLRSNCAPNCQTSAENKNHLQEFPYETEKLKFSFFPFYVRQWNSLGSSISKLLTRLRLTLSHLNQHKLCQKFRDYVSPMCNWGAEIETSQKIFLALPIPC